jgi:hypothetical protein
MTAKTVQRIATLAATTGPNGVFTPSGIAGVPDVLFHSSTLHRSATLPVRDNAVVREEVDFRGDTKHSFLVQIFQRRGTVLDAIYLFSHNKPTAARVAALKHLAKITGHRLATI